MPLAKVTSFVESLLQCQLLDQDRCDELVRLQVKFPEARALAQEILNRDWLTAFQINQVLQGKGAELTLGPYVLLERLGEGGMGQVFKARQKLLQRIVALKVIRKECLHNKKAIARFQREIRAAGQLSHPHIVRAYDADQVNGTYYIAMEYIDGVDLAQLIKDEGPIKVQRACEYIRQAALGLQHAFERGMVHRDIKPANLFYTKAVSSDRRRSSGVLRRPVNLDERKKNAPPRPDAALQYPFGVVKILDMGLARNTDTMTGRASTHLTQVGSVMGTPEFISPEQARDSHNSDIRADLYSLGCTLYFLLTGQAPFPNGTVTEKFLQHQSDDPEPVEYVRRLRMRAWNGATGPINTDEMNLRVPRRVDEVIRKLMAKSPDDRYQTPIDLANDLQDVVNQLADGTLMAQDAAERTAVILCPEATASCSPVSANEPTVAIAPMLSPAPTPRRSNPLLVKATVLLATGGGLVVVLLATVIAVLMSRSSTMQASALPVEPKPNVKDAVEPTWKRLLRTAAAQNGPWEEARRELERQRQSAQSSTQRKSFDHLLALLPSPFDELERTRFEGAFPPGLPADVVGVYGFTKGNVPRPVLSLAVSPNGRWIQTNADNAIRLFDLQSNSLFPHRIPAHSAAVTRVAFSPDGRLLASASNDGSVRVFDSATRNRLASFEKHKGPVLHFAFSPDGALAASAGRDGVIRLWDPRTGAEIRTIEGQPADIGALAFAPDGRQVFWCGAAQFVFWTDIKNAATPVAKFDSKRANLRMLAFQPGGRLAIVGNGQGALDVLEWDGTALAAKTTLKDHQQIHHVAFAADGKSFLSAGSEPSATLWDAEKLTALRAWKQPRSVAHSAAFAPDNRHFVLGAANNLVYVIRLANHDMNAIKKAAE